MAIKYVREILLEEVLLALATITSPTVGYTFNIAKRGSLMGNREPFDSAHSPSIIVESPRLQLCTPVTKETSNMVYAVDMFIHDSQFNPETAEQKASEYECKVRVALCSYSSQTLTKTGYGCGNNIEFESTGWLRRGQNTIYQISATYDLYVPANALVNV